MDVAAIRAFAASYTEAWNSGSAEAVAHHYAADGQIVINRGTPWLGRAKVAEKAAGFYADVPDIKIIFDDLRVAGDHAAYFWTFTGHHAATRAPLRVVGWEEWDFDATGKVKASRGWYDAADYARQVAGG